ncbi:MAG: DUF4079 domain-containing protein [Cyanobacteria bacterium P01_D01_bin.105]
MDLPSFIWLWRIAAWSMGFSIAVFSLLALSGAAIFYAHRNSSYLLADTVLDDEAVDSEVISASKTLADRVLLAQVWIRPLHYGLGGLLVCLVLLLLGIGVVGTLGEHGRLGHSLHLPAGLSVVALTLSTAWCATRINPARPWARQAHLILNGILLFAFILVTVTGWSVVQQYLP